MAQPSEVDPGRYPYHLIRFTVADVEQEVEAYVDTGFDGSLALPSNIFDPPLPGGEWTRWRLPDGSAVWAPVYEATLRVAGFDSMPGRITLLGDEPMVGRAVIDHFSVTFDHGRRLVLEA